MTTLTSSPNSLVSLKGGLAVPLAALQLSWSLEGRGLTVQLNGRGGLLVGPRRKLTDDDREQIAEHKDVLKALVAYVQLVEVPL